MWAWPFQVREAVRCTRARWKDFALLYAETVRLPRPEGAAEARDRAREPGLPRGRPTTPLLSRAAQRRQGLYAAFASEAGTSNDDQIDAPVAPRIRAVGASRRWRR